MSEDEEGQDRPRERRERVRKLVIDPLIDMGLRKAKAVSAEDHEAFLKRVEKRLAYLGEAHLAVMVEVISRCGEGPQRNVWPAEVSIIGWASALAPPPDEDSRLVRSWMASIEGRRAWDEGPAVAIALRRFLREKGHPPRNWDQHGIRKQAQEWLHEMQRIEERRREGTMTAAEVQRADLWVTAIEEVRAMVFAKQEAAE